MGYAAEYEVTTFIPWNLRFGKIAYSYGMKKGIILMRDNSIEEVWKPIALGLFLKTHAKFSIKDSKFDREGTLLFTIEDEKQLDALVVESQALQDEAIVTQKIRSLDNTAMEQSEIDEMFRSRNQELITTGDIKRLPIDSEEDWFP